MQKFKYSPKSENKINKIHHVRDLNPLIRNFNVLLTNFLNFHFLIFRGSANKKALIRNLNLPGALLQRRYFQNFKIIPLVAPHRTILCICDTPRYFLKEVTTPPKWCSTPLGT